MTRILVTGANGFVGSHIIEALQGRDDVTIIAACRDRRKLYSDLSYHEVREGDLTDGGYVEEVVEGVDVICHGAAWTALWGHARESDTLYLRPTLNLIDAAVRHGVKRFVNNSTASAAAPTLSHDPDSVGTPPPFFPHLANVVRIEERLRSEATKGNMAAVNLRNGIFAGRRYALGVFPILLPRLKTHLVPYVAGGTTGLPVTDGRDVGRAFALAALHPSLKGYEGFNILGPEVPTVREVLEHLQEAYSYPAPHFSVPFPVAYAFGWLMEKLDPLVPWEPLVVRSIVHLLEEVRADNGKAERVLGYRPLHPWKEAIGLQIQEMTLRQEAPMSMARPVDQHPTPRTKEIR